MSEFFRQLIVQLSALWQKLSFQQKLITSSLIGFTLLGLVGLLVFAHSTGGGGGGGRGGGSGGMRILYSDLDLQEASQITQELQKNNYKYRLENNGRDILVQPKQLYEIRMALAREGLPRKSGIGYELFDKSSLGMTDYVQKLNARRALEGELQRTIEGLDEVKTARVHIVIPEHTIFLDQQKDAKASVVLRCIPGRSLSKDQIKGITHLVSSSVEGLKPQYISIVDIDGKLLSSPFAGDELAMSSSTNMELRQNVERALENKTSQMLSTVFGHAKSQVKVSAELDFDKVEKTVETFDPESRVIRSEERSEENTKNAPDGDHQRERSTTNYEIDRTVQRVVQEVGTIKRLTVSVVVDGRYEIGSDGRSRVFMERSPDEMQKIEDLVKNAVGYDLARGDQIVVASLQFDNELLDQERQRMLDEEGKENRMLIIKIALAVLVGIVFLLLIRSIAKIVTEAMNPPVPVLEELGLEIVEDEDPSEEEARAKMLLEKVEVMANMSPVNTASIIRQWLSSDSGQPVKQKKK